MGLSRLRDDPFSEIQKSYFFFPMDGLPTLDPDHMTQGIRGRLSEKSYRSLRDRYYSVFKLQFTQEANGTDYYFPYTFGTDGGFGSVAIPYDEVQNGTIAITGGMNGCALEVRADNERRQYVFYHDTNGNNHNAIERIGGELICRIDADAYYGREVIDEADRLHNRYPYYPINWVVLFICVYHKSYWMVVASGVYHYGNDVQGVFIPTDHTEPVPRQKSFYGIFNNDQFRTFRFRHP